MTDARHRVTLLTQNDCHLCEHAKVVLARVGIDFRIEVEEISLSSTPGRRLAAEAGVLFAPGVLVDGRPFAFGRLSERKLRKALTIARDGSSGSRGRCGGEAVEGRAADARGSRSRSDDRT